MAPDRRRDPWTPRPPREANGEEEDGSANGRRWERTRIIGVDLDGAVLHDLSVSGCDVAAVLIRSGGGRRIAVRETRLREVALPGARLHDVAVSDVQAERLSLRFAQLTAVTFTRCSLVGADFSGSTFDHVTFHDCDLTEARFDNAVVRALRTCGVTFTGITGAASLSGAAVAPQDLLSLAAPLAISMGIRLADEVADDERA